MISKRHFIFNVVIIIFPWLTLLLMDKRDFKRFSFAGVFIIIFEIINHRFGQKRKWWYFFDKRKSFLTNELPFSIGPYMPISMWVLKYSYGNFAKFLMLNALFDGMFATILMPILKRLRILKLKRLNTFQFFCYLYYKTFLLYGVQYLVERARNS